MAIFAKLYRKNINLMPFMFACRVYKLYNATKDYTQQTHGATIV